MGDRQVVYHQFSSKSVIDAEHIPGLSPGDSGPAGVSDVQAQSVGGIRPVWVTSEWEFSLPVAAGPGQRPGCGKYAGHRWGPGCRWDAVAGVEE